MINVFFKRWHVTRRLYKYIYRDRRTYGLLSRNNNSWPDFGTTTKKDRIQKGIPEETFLQWYWWRWETWGELDDQLMPDNFWSRFWFNLPWRKKRREYFKQDIHKTITECIKLDWIEKLENGNLHIGTRGMDAKSWYYPLVAFFQFCEKNKYAWAIAVTLIGWSPLIRPYIQKIISSIFN